MTNEDLLEITIKNIEKDFGKGAVFTVGDEPQPIPRFSSGSRKLDKALGGGWPRGRICEIYGMESTGKSTCSLHAIAEIQRLGERAALVEPENAFDATYAKKLGVKTEELLISQPNSGEEALEIVSRLASTGQISLIVVDSVSALVPKAELEGEIGDNHIGLQARLMSQAMRKLAGIAHRTNTTIIFLNQIRVKIGIVFSNPEVTSGGNALKFFASVRAEMRRTSGIKANEEATATISKIKIVKNKTAPPYKVAEVQIDFGTGFNSTLELLQEAVEQDVVNKSGAWYSYNNERIGQGKDNTVTFLKERPDIAKRIEEQLDHKAPLPVEAKEPVVDEQK